ncbi:hypothetical protein PIB30_022415 [Stylosanthes scabra]|uniref:Uncharacterized protein n=1 Tax=Stylosanthes scabra TaxID=79078 RepID=A0ABU6Q9U2_9FABA|nr:hypothetical protein [Stylosanthes scabra]
MLPTKVGSVGKGSAHNSQGREFEPRCRCEDFIGRRSVSTSVSVYRAVGPALALVKVLRQRISMARDRYHLFRTLGSTSSLDERVNVPA